MCPKLNFSSASNPAPQISSMSVNGCFISPVARAMLKSALTPFFPSMLCAGLWTILLALPSNILECAHFSPTPLPLPWSESPLSLTLSTVEVSFVVSLLPSLSLSGLYAQQSSRGDPSKMIDQPTLQLQTLQWLHIVLTVKARVLTWGLALLNLTPQLLPLLFAPSSLPSNHVAWHSLGMPGMPVVSALCYGCSQPLLEVLPLDIQEANFLSLLKPSPNVNFSLRFTLSTLLKWQPLPSTASPIYLALFLLT